MDWLLQNWPLLIGAVYLFVSGSGMIVGMFDGPRADKAKGIFDYILGILRSLGAGTYKNEPGSVSMPGKGDTGKRVPTEFQ